MERGGNVRAHSAAAPASPTSPAAVQRAQNHQRCRQLDQWLEFTLRQAARAAPHPAPARLVSASGVPAAYCLALHHFESLPLFQAADRAFDVRVGVTLFDEGAGCFFGPTARSAPVAYDMRKSKGKRGFHLDLDCEFFLHTRADLAPASAAAASARGSFSSGANSSAHLSRCAAGASTPIPGMLGASGASSSSGIGGSSGSLLAVVEVVLVERNDEGLACAEFSAGWCAVPLELPGSCGRWAGPCATAIGGGVWQHQQQHSYGGQRPTTLPCSPAKGQGLAAPAGTYRGSVKSRSGPSTPPFSVGLNSRPSTSPLKHGMLTTRLTALSVPVFAGSPRYLLLWQALQGAAGQHCPPPEQLTADGTECRLHYQFEPCPVVASWAPLVPDNFLVSSRDVVPGVQRALAEPFGREYEVGRGSGPMGDGAAAPRAALGVLGICSHLAPPRLHAVGAVVLAGLRVHLPDGFLEVVRRQAAGLWRQAHGATPASGSRSFAAAAAMAPIEASGAARLLPLQELQRHLQLRVSVHNGRQFVGPPVVCAIAGLEPVEGRRGEHEVVLEGKGAMLAWLPFDRFVAVVLELLLLPHGCRERETGASSGGSGPGQAGSSNSDSMGTEMVLGWAAAVPFDWHGSSFEPIVAEGKHQVALRSGPGRWLRQTPVLDWRRLLERTNRPSPQAPIASFVLQEAPGQGIWPPPNAPVSQQPTAAAAPPARRQLSTAASLLARPPAAPLLALRQERRQPSAAASEAETLVDVRAHPHCHPPHDQQQHQGSLGSSKGMHGSSKGSAPTGKGKALAPQATLHAWQIHAQYDIGAGASTADAIASTEHINAPWQMLPHPLPIIRTRQQLAEADAALEAPGPSTGDEAAALYAGSPTAKHAHRRQLSMAATQGSAYGSATAASAAAAAPAAAVAERHISLAAELADGLVASEATLQFLAFEAEGGSSSGSTSSCCYGSGGPDSGGCCGVPPRLHFTWRCFTGPPTVTAPLQLEPVACGSDVVAGSSSSSSDGQSRLYPLVPAADRGSGREDASATPELPLQLLDATALERQLCELAAHGLAESAVASLARQQCLQVAKYLSERCLSVDVWSSESSLHVGTLSVPLRGLLRQGQQEAEVIVRVAVADHAQAVQRVEAGPGGGGASASSGVQQCSVPLRGSFVLRLASKGRHLQLPSVGGAGDGGGRSASSGSAWGSGSNSWPTSPLKHGCPSGQALVVRAGPALVEAGQVAAELARHQGVPATVAGERLREEVVSRAARKVQHLLQYQALAGPAAVAKAGGADGDGGSGAGYSSACQQQRAPGGPSEEGRVSTAAAWPAAAAPGPAAVERMVGAQLLGEVAAARQRCKRGSILARLQAELPACVALSTLPGDCVGFEWQFVNSSSEAAWFELTSTTNAGGTSSGNLDTSNLGSSSWIAAAGQMADCSSSRSSPGSGALPTTLRLVTSEEEWRALEPAARLAGLTVSPRPWDAPRGSSSCPRTVTSTRFQLAPHERCLLRMKLTHSLHQGCSPNPESCFTANGSSSSGSSGSSMLLAWHDVSIMRLGGPSGAAHAASLQVAVVPLASEPPTDRTLRLYCPAGPSAGAEQRVAHAVRLSQLAGGSRLLQAAHSAGGIDFVSSSLSACAVLQQPEGLALLRCPAPVAGATQRLLLAAHPAGSSSSSSSSTGGRSVGHVASSLSDCTGRPLEVWEVFIHGLPVLPLNTSVGAIAAASQLLGGRAGAGSAVANQLRCFWRGGCQCGELEAAIASPAEHAAPASRRGGGGGGSAASLALRWMPATITRRELLLAVVGPGRRRQLQPDPVLLLLLVQLDSSSTAVSRRFEVQLARGQLMVSKKVRYCSPYPPHQRRCFAVRAMQPQWLRIGTPRFELAGGECAAIKMTFGASVGGCGDTAGMQSCLRGGRGACSSCSGDGLGSESSCTQACPQLQRHQHQPPHVELLAVVESFTAEHSCTSASGGGGTTGGSRGGGAGAKVEEVFRVLLTMGP